MAAVSLPAANASQHGERSMWQAMGDKTSSIATITEDTFEFTWLILQAYLMEVHQGRLARDG